VTAGVRWLDLPVPPRSALVVVDVQRGFVDASTSPAADEVMSLLRSRGAEFETVIATRFFNLPGSLFRTAFQWDRLAGPPETDLVDGLDAFADFVVDKTTYGAATELNALLRQRSARHVYLCGIDTDVCVLSSAAGLFDLGWKANVLVDACGTGGGSEAQASAIPLLRRTVGPEQVIELRP